MKINTIIAEHKVTKEQFMFEMVDDVVKMYISSDGLNIIEIQDQHQHHSILNTI